MSEILWHAMDGWKVPESSITIIQIQKIFSDFYKPANGEIHFKEELVKKRFGKYPLMRLIDEYFRRFKDIFILPFLPNNNIKGLFFKSTYNFFITEL